MSLPEFFIVGAPGAGTTALHAALATHPNLYLPAVKEPRFFLSDGREPARARPGLATHARGGVDLDPRRRTRQLFAPAPAARASARPRPTTSPTASALERIRNAVPTLGLSRSCATPSTAPTPTGTGSGPTRSRPATSSTRSPPRSTVP